MATGVPPPGHRQPDQAGQNQPGGAVDGKMLGVAQQAQGRDDDGRERRGAGNGEAEPADRRPGASRPGAATGLDEQSRGAYRGGDDTGQNQGCEHCGPHSVFSKSLSRERADPGQPGPALRCWRAELPGSGLAMHGPACCETGKRMLGRSGLG